MSAELPTLETCLFGPTGKCPKVTTSAGTVNNSKSNANKSSPSLSSFLEDNNETKQSASNNEAETDSPHDIDIAVLRKLASQGIPDEASYRGIVWRVLLGYLPTQNIHQEWKETLPPQRHLYRTLVDQYLYKTVDDDNDDSEDHNITHSTLDSGRELRGQLSKTLHRSRQLRQNYNRIGSLDGSMNDVSDWSEHERSESASMSEDNCDDGVSMVSEWTMPATKQQQQQAAPFSPQPPTPSSGTPQSSKKSAAFLRNSAARRRSSSQMNATQRIHSQLPAKYQEQWKQAGIILDKSESAAALSLNHLRIPQELLELKRKETRGTDDGDCDDNNSDKTIPENGNDRDKTATPESETKPSNDKKEDDTDPSERADMIFAQFMQDAKTLSEIRKDVVRTHPDLRFYLEPQDNLGIRRYAALERILFVWAKLNKGVRYVQGMNEIAATLYYVLANDLNADFAVYAEADTYYLFHTLMSGNDMMRDVFVADLDDSTCGIQGRIANMQGLLERHDPELFLHLEEIGMDASFYAIRWLTTLLSREFLLPDTIRLWDSMFSSTHKENFLRYACGTMVMNVRDELIRGDFSHCLRLLQSYPPTNVDDILEASRALWIYESQVTLACHRGGITLNQALHHIQPPPGIIMAFGLKGGVAPSLSDQIQDAANVVQEQVEQTTTGLFSRAKRFLRKESGSNAATAGSSSTSDDSQGQNEEKEQPESESEKQEEAVKQEDDPETSDPKEEEDAKMPAAPAAGLRQKIWTAWGNRGKAAPPLEAVEEKTETEEKKEIAAETAAPSSPKRTPII